MDESLDILRVICGAFEEIGIEYMIVGSTAMRAYIPGRSTFGTDVLVRMSPQQLEQLADLFGDQWYLDRKTAQQCLESQRMFNAIHFKTSWKLDLIPLKDDPFHKTEFERRRCEQIADSSCFVQTPEDLILSKLQWAVKGGSKRQVEDVRSVLRAGLRLDELYLAKWSSELGLGVLLNEARNG